MSKDDFFSLRCIELAEESLDTGEAPFASLVVRGDEVVAESINSSTQRVSDHAEVLALHKAHQKLGSKDLSQCTLYTICEPCPMCSFMIREYKINKVVFSLPSPFVGGYTKWKILQDEEISQFKDFFNEPPKVIVGLHEEEAKAVFDRTPLWMFGAHMVRNFLERRSGMILQCLPMSLLKSTASK